MSYASVMKTFLRAISTGFALSLGAALFKKVSKQLGLDEKLDPVKKEDDKNPATNPVGQDGATDPNVQDARFS